MKRIHLIVLALLLCAGGYARSAKETKKEAKAAMEEALSYAENIAFVHTDLNAKILKPILRSNPLRGVDNEHRALIFYTEDASGLDASVEQREPLVGTRLVRFSASNKMSGIGLYDGRDYIIVAGTYFLRVPRNGSIAEKAERGISFEIDTLTIHFEAGKFYTINGRLDKDNKIEFSIKETDTTAYTVFQDANPTHLNGTWSGEKKNIYNRYSMQYTINGNRMTFEEMAGKNPFVGEGSIMYNGNTLIFIPEKAVTKGREVEDFASYPPYLWYYTLTDGVLHLEGGNITNPAGARPFRAKGLTGWENAGEFREIK